MFFYALKEFKNRNIISFGILFFLITISLVSNVFFLIESVMAERFTYMPSLGFCVAFVFLLVKVFKVDIKFSDKVNFSALYKSNKLFFVVVFLISFLFSVKTISRNSDWKNNLTLLAVDVKTNATQKPNEGMYVNRSAITDSIKKKTAIDMKISRRIYEIFTCLDGKISFDHDNES